jgi:hypothetical protein
MPEVAGQLEQFDPRIVIPGGQHELITGVATAIIDEHRLGGAVHEVHHVAQLLRQVRDRLFFVVDGDDDGVIRDLHGICSFAAAVIAPDAGRRYARIPDIWDPLGEECGKSPDGYRRDT